MLGVYKMIKRPPWLLTLGLISFLAILWLQAPRLSDEFRVDEDFRTFYWMNKFQDPELFPNQSNDYMQINLFEYQLPLALESLGYGLLFYIASFFVSPVLFSKIIPFILMPVTLWYLFKYGESIRDRTLGLTLALSFLFFNLASSSSISITNGLQRSFALSLVIALMYYLHQRRYVAAGMVIFLSALVYAPALAIGAVVWGLHIKNSLRIRWPFQWDLAVAEQGLGHLLIALCLSALFLSPFIVPHIANAFFSEAAAQSGHQAQTGTSSVEGSKSFWENPRYGQGGASQIFVIFPLVGRGGLVDLGEDLINLAILLIFACLIYLVRKRQAFDLPFEIKCVLWASLIVYVLAWMVVLLTDSFLLYLPSRYTRVGLFLFLFLFVFINASDFMKEATELIQHNVHHLRWLIVIIELVVLLLLFLYPSERAMIKGFNMKWPLALAGLALGMLGIAALKKAGRSASKLPNLTRSKVGRVLIGVTLMLALGGWAVYVPVFTEVSYLNPSQSERELFAFVETLPKDSLLAGSPCILDSIPLFSKRQIFFSCEQPGKIDNPDIVYEALKTYYTDDKQAVVDFCRSYGIDYLVIDLNTYSTEYLTSQRVFFEPYNQRLQAEISGQNTFILAHVPDEIKLFQSGDYYVISCAVLKTVEPQAFK